MSHGGEATTSVARSLGGPEFWEKVAIGEGIDQREIGRKEDNGKLRWDLVPFESLEEIIKVLMYGANKYSDNNWLKVEKPRIRYFAAAMRHLVAWFKGEKFDPESKLHHLAHAGCCILFLLHFDK